MVKNTGLTLKELLVILVIITVMMALIIPAVLNAREAARDSVCFGKMAGLKHALDIFKRSKGHFPAAVFSEPDSESQHSWRMLILPYLGGGDVSDQYRFNEPWDSKHNSSLFDQDVASWFQCPSGVDLEQNELTNYVCVQGPHTTFPEGKGVEVNDITDGPENTVLIVEAHGLGIHWREPRDLDIETMSFAPNTWEEPCINSPHPTGPIIVFADSAYYRVSDTVTGSDIKAFLTIAAGDSPRRDELDRGGVILGR